MTIEELFSADNCFYVHTGKRHLEEFVRICESYDIWWCGQRNERTPEASIAEYIKEKKDEVGLKILIDGIFRSFYFINADFPIAIEYEDLIESKKIDFSDFDSVF